MLKITISSIEQYDEVKNEFISTKEQVLHLEHSLVSLSKWESKWLKPFLTKEEKTIDETLDYVKCMTITQNVPEDTYSLITNDHIKLVRDYIDAAMTATTFSNENKGTNREIITAEVIYHWMIAMNVPFECQKWHLNRLLTLINVCNIKANPPKKMGKKALMRRNADLNAARRRAAQSGG